MLMSTVRERDSLRMSAANFAFVFRCLKTEELGNKEAMKVEEERECQEKHRVPLWTGIHH